MAIFKDGTIILHVSILSTLYKHWLNRMINRRIRDFILFTYLKLKNSEQHENEFLNDWLINPVPNLKH
jgi:hypothetical protein